jgi:hypothetical protein
MLGKVIMEKLINMEQIYIKYTLWEDFIAGMYNSNDVLDKDKKVIDSINLLSNPNDFYEICQNILDQWKNASDVNLSNKNQNRKAWLGAAACMYKCNAPEYLTRIAWSLLNKQTQDKANKIAEKIILEYERKNRKIYSNVGKQMLF